METKTCSITEDEIKELLIVHGQAMSDNFDEAVERITYLYKRLKAEKKEVEVKTQPTEQKVTTTW